MAEPKTASPSARKTEGHSFIGTVKDAKHSVRARRDSRTKPQPWIVRKLMVAITVGIMGYAGYVYIGRFALGMIHNGHRGRGSQSFYLLLGRASILLI